MESAKASLLIIEDDLDIAEMLDAYFRMAGYSVKSVNWGEDGVTECINHTPDVVILDIRLPDIDGFEVARRLRANRRTREIPILFLTEKRERIDRLQGLSLKAEDYITKPFDVQELRLRVSNVLERTRRSSLTNAITGLPEGSLVDEQLLRALGTPRTAISVVSLTHLGRFREVYGFVASDDVLRGVALMLQDVISSHGAAGDFLGHFDQNNFILIAAEDHLSALKDKIEKRVAQSFNYFYRDQDLNSAQFRNHRLNLAFYDFPKAARPVHSVAELKVELEKLIR